MDEIIEVLSMEIDVLDDDLYNLDDSDLLVVLYEKSQNILMVRTKEMLDRSPAFIEFLESIKPEQLFDVKMTGSAREMYEKGEWVLKYSKKKEGLIPILSNKEGKFVEQVTLNQKQVTAGIIKCIVKLKHAAATDTVDGSIEIDEQVNSKDRNRSKR